MKEKEIMNKRNEHVINKNRIFELLRVNKIPDQIELIKDLPIIALKDLDVQTNHIIKKILGISTIKELAEVEISPEEMREIRSMGVSVSSLEKWIAASKIISDIDKIKNENKKKIVFMGLDNAGKTTIINLITGKFGLNTRLNYQQTSNSEVLPLPEFSGYAALYWAPHLHFSSTGGSLRFQLGLLGLWVRIGNRIFQESL